MTAHRYGLVLRGRKGAGGFGHKRTQRRTKNAPSDAESSQPRRRREERQKHVRRRPHMPNHAGETSASLPLDALSCDPSGPSSSCLSLWAAACVKRKMNSIDDRGKQVQTESAAGRHVPLLLPSPFQDNGRHPDWAGLDNTTTQALTNPGLRYGRWPGHSAISQGWSPRRISVGDLSGLGSQTRHREP